MAEEELTKLCHYGASKIIKVEDSRIDGLVNKAFAAIIAQVAEKESADVVVFSHNFTGKALAPRVAVKLKAGMASGVNALPDSLQPFIVKKGVFTGKAIGHIAIKSPKKILTLFPNSVETVASDEKATIESFTPQLTDAHFTTKVLDVKKVTDKILLTDAEVVVSGGRGMKGGDKWGPLEELAGLLRRCHCLLQACFRRRLAFAPGTCGPDRKDHRPECLYRPWYFRRNPAPGRR